MRFSFPITKIEKQADGSLLVGGCATDESIDSQGDILDFDGSVKAFAGWRGNVREAHDPKKPVGKALNVTFDENRKAIDVEAFISAGAPDTQQKLLDGVLRSFSVGGGNPTKVRMEKVGDKTVRRVLEWPMSELSVVDVGANPNANIELVKADGVATEALAVEEAPVPAAPPAPEPNRFAEKLLKATKEMEAADEPPADDEADEPTACAKCMKVHKEGVETCDKMDLAAAETARAKKGVEEAKAKHKVARAKEDLAAAKGNLEAVKGGGEEPPGDEAEGDGKDEPEETDEEKTKKAAEGGGIQKKAFSADERKKLAEAGEAMPDGSFPTPTKADWHDAVQSLGRAPAGKRPSVKAYLRRRAKKLGIGEDELPPSLKALEASLRKHWGAGEEYDLEAALQIVFGIKNLILAESAEEAEGEDEGNQIELLETAYAALAAFIAAEAGELEAPNPDKKAPVGGAMMAEAAHMRAESPIFIKALHAALTKRFELTAPVAKSAAPDTFTVNHGDQLAEGIGKGLSAAVAPIAKATVELKGLFEAELKDVRKSITDLGKTAAVPMPLRSVPRPDETNGRRGVENEIATLEKALATATHPETMTYLRQQIAFAKARP